MSERASERVQMCQFTSNRFLGVDTSLLQACSLYHCLSRCLSLVMCLSIAVHHMRRLLSLCLSLVLCVNNRENPLRTKMVIYYNDLS